MASPGALASPPMAIVTSVLAATSRCGFIFSTKPPTAFFYHFDVVEDRAVCRALCDAAFDWARGRGLERMWGPKGLIHVDGPGVLVEGFEHRPAMGIPYNYPYYDELLKDAGFEMQVSTNTSDEGRTPVWHWSIFKPKMSHA